MNPKMIWANLAVSDLEQTTRFYTELGFKPNGTPSKELTSFFFGEGDFVMHFFLKEVLQTNIKSEIADSQRVMEVVFTLSAGSRTGWTIGKRKSKGREGGSFPDRKNLGKDTTVFFLPTRMATGSMSFTWKVFNRQCCHVPFKTENCRRIH